MGNVSSIREGEEEGQQQEGEGQAFSSHSQGESEDLIGQSPPQSPRRAARSPLLFTPQVISHNSVFSLSFSQFYLLEKKETKELAFLMCYLLFCGYLLC